MDLYTNTCCDVSKNTDNLYGIIQVPNLLPEYDLTKKKKQQSIPNKRDMWCTSFPCWTLSLVGFQTKAKPHRPQGLGYVFL